MHHRDAQVGSWHVTDLWLQQSYLAPLNPRLRPTWRRNCICPRGWRFQVFWVEVMLHKSHFAAPLKMRATEGRAPCFIWEEDPAACWRKPSAFLKALALHCRPLEHVQKKTAKCTGKALLHNFFRAVRPRTANELHVPQRLQASGVLGNDFWQVLPPEPIGGGTLRTKIHCCRASHWHLRGREHCNVQRQLQFVTESGLPGGSKHACSFPLASTAGA